MRVCGLGFGTLVAAILVAAGCTATPGTISPTVSGSAMPTAEPVATASAVGVSSSGPSVSPSASAPGGSSSPAPSESGYPNDEPPVPSWHTGAGGIQAQLLATLRDDATVACDAIKTVPSGALAGVECHPSAAVVALVRIYGFVTPDAALSLYRSRLAAAGIALRTGDCQAGKAGDEPWTPGDGQWGPGGVEPDRDGCFDRASGVADVLTLCGNGAFIEVVGRKSDIAAVAKWADRIPASAIKSGTVSEPGPPGICYGGRGA